MLLRPSLVAPNLPEHGTICFRCLARLSSFPNAPAKRQFNISSSRKEPLAAAPRPIRRKLFRREYFSANGILALPTSLLEQAAAAKDPPEARTRITTNHAIPANLPASPPEAASDDQPLSSLLPHRRRKRLKELASPASTPNAAIPPDASSLLSTLSARAPPTSLRRLLTTYLSLSKPRLSFLIVLTTTSAYSLYPVPALLSPETTTSPSLSALTLLFLTTGTALASASANTLNMLFEPTHDAKMSRTRNRPLVRGLISKRGALLFAIITGIIGTGTLYVGVNPTVSFLGAANIALYAGIYTPLKRISVLNTWVGALVGGIPPLMGWAAAAGQSATGNGSWRELLFAESSVGGWLLAGLLYAWQFPHFNALSWTIRHEYREAGYRMLAWVNPAMNARVALRYSLVMFPICAGLWVVGVTDRGFLVSSGVVNAWVVREAWRFYRLEGGGGSARGLFWAGVWQLPGVMVLAMVHKKGLWEGWGRWVRGEVEGEEEGED
ncbi:protoheme IX farnesyltransferase [Physcia stellaris]|nr:protoheme IX farnesyltransferase [Physcia stellaris]